MFRFFGFFLAIIIFFLGVLFKFLSNLLFINLWPQWIYKPITDLLFRLLLLLLRWFYRRYWIKFWRWSYFCKLRFFFYLRLGNTYYNIIYARILILTMIDKVIFAWLWWYVDTWLDWKEAWQEGVKEPGLDLILAFLDTCFFYYCRCYCIFMSLKDYFSDKYKYCIIRLPSLLQFLFNYAYQKPFKNFPVYHILYLDKPLSFFRFVLGLAQLVFWVYFFFLCVGFFYDILALFFSFFGIFFDDWAMVQIIFFFSFFLWFFFLDILCRMGFCIFLYFSGYKRERFNFFIFYFFFFFFLGVCYLASCALEIDFFYLCTHEFYGIPRFLRLGLFYSLCFGLLASYSYLAYRCFWLECREPSAKILP